MKVTKQQVMQALATEPLLPGNFVLLSNETTGKFGSVCPVCAVGAVIRSIGIENYDIHKVAQNNTKHDLITHGNPIKLLQNGKPWNALSVFFEVAAADLAMQLGVHESDLMPIDMKPVRAETIDWVDKNFPEELELDI